MVKPTEIELEPHTRQLLTQIDLLPKRQRALLMSHLLEGMELLGDGETEDKEEGYDQAWEVEIRRRLTEIDEGKVQMVPWEQVRRELRGIISGDDRTA